MSSHDEYSSDEEEFEDSSNVFIGFTDVAFDEEDEEPTIEDLFIGGTPIWLHEDSTPNKDDLKCGNCHKDMALLLQAFAPLEDKPYDRVIYIFACKDTSQCSRKKGSVRAIRGVCKDPARIAEVEQEQAQAEKSILNEKLRLEEKKMRQLELTKDLFDATKPSTEQKNPFGGNPFGKAENPFGSAGNPFGGNPFGAEAKAEAPKPAAEKPKPKQKNSKPSKPAAKSPDKAMPSYPGYFIYTEAEKFKKVTLEPELEKYKHLIETAEPGKKERTLSSSSGSSSAALNPENRKIAQMLSDKHFENFSSVVNHNPHQVLRYDLGGRPLLYNGTDDVAKTFAAGVPDPAYNPSSLRRFELQLMPKAILDLEKSDTQLVQDILGGMSWGTITVATDVEDYMPQLDSNHVGYVVEYCGVQWEES